MWYCRGSKEGTYVLECYHSSGMDGYYFSFLFFFSHWCGGLMFVIQKTCQEVNIRCRAVQRDLPKVTSFKYQRQWIKFIKLEMWLSPTLLFASFLLSLFSHLPHNQQQLFVTYFFFFFISPWDPVSMRIWSSTT